MPKQPEQVSSSLQKVEYHRAVKTGKGQITFSLPPCSLLSTTVFPSRYRVSQGQQSQNVLAHLGPHAVTVHIPTGKLQKHSVPSGKVTSYTILGEYLRG